MTALFIVWLCLQWFFIGFIWGVRLSKGAFE